MAVTGDGRGTECRSSSNFKLPSCLLLAEAHTPDIMKVEGGQLVREREYVSKSAILTTKLMQGEFIILI